MAYHQNVSYEDYFAGKRVAAASGFILGARPPLPPIRRHDQGQPPSHRQREGKYVEGAKKGWETRRRNHGSDL